MNRRMRCRCAATGASQWAPLHTVLIWGTKCLSWAGCFLQKWEQTRIPVTGANTSSPRRGWNQASILSSVSQMHTLDKSPLLSWGRESESSCGNWRTEKWRDSCNFWLGWHHNWSSAHVFCTYQLRMREVGLKDARRYRDFCVVY